MVSRFRDWLAERGAFARWLITLAAVGLIAFGGYRIWASVASDVNARRAEEAMDKRDFLGAKALLAKALQERPNSPQLTFLAARAARRNGDFKEARQLLKRAEELAWADEAITFERNLLDAQTIDFRRAEAPLAEYAKLDPPKQDTELVVDVLVMGYMQDYDLGHALDLLQIWIPRRPKDVRLRLWQHEAASRLNSLTLSKDTLQAAYEIEPENAEVRAKLAIRLSDSHLAAEAKVHFDWLLVKEPKNRAYRIGLARCLRELSEFDAAIRTLDDLLAADPNDAAVLTQRGYTDLLSGRPQQALPYFRRAFAIDTHELDLLANYALCLEQCGLTEEAKGMRERQRNADADLRELEEASKSVLNQPTDPLPRFRAAQLLARNGQFIEARRWVESALRVDPNHRPSQQLYAELLLKRLDPRPPTTPAKAGS